MLRHIQHLLYYIRSLVLNPCNGNSLCISSNAVVIKNCGNVKIKYRGPSSSCVHVCGPDDQC